MDAIDTDRIRHRRRPWMGIALAALSLLVTALFMAEQRLTATAAARLHRILAEGAARQRPSIGEAMAALPPVPAEQNPRLDYEDAARLAVTLAAGFDPEQLREAMVYYGSNPENATPEELAAMDAAMRRLPEFLARLDAAADRLDHSPFINDAGANEMQAACAP